MQPQHLFDENLDTVLLDPSLFTTRGGLELPFEAWLGDQKKPRFLVPSTLLAALDGQRGNDELLWFWGYWGGSRLRPPFPDDVASTLRTLVQSGRLEAYTPEASAIQELGFNSLDNFEDRLGLSVRRRPFVSKILFEELAYLATHSVVLGRSRRPYDAFVNAGAIVVQFAESHLPPDAVEKLRKLGWKRVATKIGVSLGGAVTAALNPAVGIAASPVVAFIGLLDP